MKFDTFTQAEFPGQIINRTPRFGQERHDPAAVVEVDHRVENLAEDGIVTIRAMVVGIHCRRR
ncbi:MAG TPA: hypothetical protein VIL69_06485 [Roseomonas sp.]